MKLFSSPGWKVFRQNKLGAAALGIVLAFFLTAIGFEIYAVVCEEMHLVPVYAIGDPHVIYAPPSPAHWCGTDYQGRDVLLRALAGCATAVKVGLVASTIAAVIGILLGAFAGYYGGRMDDFVVWLYSVFASLPTLLFILAFALLFSRNYLSPALYRGVAAAGKVLHADPGTLAVYAAIGLTGWVTLCRVVRAETLKLKTLPFVAAAKVAGVRDWRIVFRHIIPNVFHLAIIYFTLSFAGAIMLEVIVSYLGFGVQNAPSWGVMISDGQERLWRGIWWELATATGFLFVLVLALNLLGDALRDALDPRRRS